MWDLNSGVRGLFLQYIAGSSLKYGSGNIPKKRKIECALVTHQKNQKMENQVLVWNLKLLMAFSQVRFWKHTQKKKNWPKMCSCNTPKKINKGKIKCYSGTLNYCFQHMEGGWRLGCPVYHHKQGVHSHIKKLQESIRDHLLGSAMVKVNKTAMIADRKCIFSSNSSNGQK